MRMFLRRMSRGEHLPQGLTPSSLRLLNRGGRGYAGFAPVLL